MVLAQSLAKVGTVNNAVNDFDIQKCSRRCIVTGRELVPGEEFYSVLIADKGEIIRQDVSLGAWKGEPENAIGSWRSKVPDASAPKLTMAPHDLILQYFEELLNQGTNPELCYVLTLLMIRRKIARLEESMHESNGDEVLVVYCPKREQEYRVPVIDLSAERVQSIQDEIAKLLFSGSSA